MDILQILRSVLGMSGSVVPTGGVLAVGTGGLVPGAMVEGVTVPTGLVVVVATGLLSVPLLSFELLKRAVSV